MKTAWDLSGELREQWLAACSCRTCLTAWVSTFQRDAWEQGVREGHPLGSTWDDPRRNERIVFPGDKVKP
jgi:hypothetical protein